MGKRSKPNSAKNISTAEKAVSLIGMKADHHMIRKGLAINPIDDGSNGPHTTEAWLPGKGPGKRGVITKSGTEANLAAASDMGYDPSQAQAVLENLDSGRAFDDRKLAAPADRGGDPSRRPNL